jgi:hypothetical protein
MIAWQQRAGPAERRQGRKPAETVAHTASLAGAPFVRQRASHAIMAAHPAEHAQQDATLRTMALGTLILNALSVRAAPGRFIRCRCSAIQTNVQTNTYDPRRPGATWSLLPCRHSPSLAWQSASRRSCAVLRQIAIGRKPDQALRQQIPRRFVAVDMPNPS